MTRTPARKPYIAVTKRIQAGTSVGSVVARALRVKMILPALLEANAGGGHMPAVASRLPCGTAGGAVRVDDANVGDETLSASLRHVLYAGGWKKLERVWDAVIRMMRVAAMLPLLEGTLDAFGRARAGASHRDDDLPLGVPFSEIPKRLGNLA